MTKNQNKKPYELEKENKKLELFLEKLQKQSEKVRKKVEEGGVNFKYILKKVKTIERLFRRLEGKGMKTKMKCKVCKKEFEYYDSVNPNREFCSTKCKGKYWRKNKISTFFDSKLQSKRGKKGGKASVISNKKNGTSLWDSKVRRKCYETQKNNKLGFFDSKLQSKLGKKGAKRLRENKGYYWKGNYFASSRECEIGMCVSYQFNIKLKEGVNFQKEVDYKSFDYFLFNYLFLEFHQVLKFFQPDETEKSYYKKRRNILNENGYKDYPLIVIK